VLLLIVAGVAVLGFAPAPLPKQQRQREDRTDVAGLWQIVVWEDSGERDEPAERGVQVKMTKERITFVNKRDEKPVADLAMRLEPSAVPPAITWSNRLGGVGYVGSYRLHGDDLTMIVARGNSLAERPTDFAGKPEIRLVLKRIKRD
jgi:uncharacterized protein (TIGR03067 family)